MEKLLEDYKNRHDSFIENLGKSYKAMKFITKLPGGQKLIGSVMKKRFNKLALSEHGTIHFLNDNMEEQIEAYWGGKENNNNYLMILENLSHILIIQKLSNQTMAMMNQSQNQNLISKI